MGIEQAAQERTAAAADVDRHGRAGEAGTRGDRPRHRPGQFGHGFVEDRLGVGMRGKVIVERRAQGRAEAGSPAAHGLQQAGEGVVVGLGHQDADVALRLRMIAAQWLVRLAQAEAAFAVDIEHPGHGQGAQQQRQRLRIGAGLRGQFDGGARLRRGEVGQAQARRHRQRARERAARGQLRRTQRTLGGRGFAARRAHRVLLGGLPVGRPPRASRRSGKRTP
nr:hypothetical protein [Lysobacter enzymogenes]